jgi:hypothetical protein
MPLEPVSAESGLNPGPNLVQFLFSFLLPATDFPAAFRLMGWETSVTIPEEFTDSGDTLKYEVLAREESFNQTAVESCFVLVE